MTITEILSFSADIAGIISLLISIATLLLASGIRSSISKQVEKNDYMRDIDDQLIELTASYESLLDGKIAIDDEFYDLILHKLEVFPIRYERILKSKIVKEINALIDYIECMCKRNPSEKRHRQECASKLHRLILILEKEKKVL